MELKKISPPPTEDVFELTLTRSQLIAVRVGMFNYYVQLRDSNNDYKEEAEEARSLWQELSDKWIVSNKND